MADLVDRFSGGAGTLATHSADSPDTWTDPSDDYAIDGSGSLYGVSGFSGLLAYSSWVPPSADYAAKMVIGASYNAVSSTTAFGPCVRVSGPSGQKSGYYLQIYSVSGVYKAMISRSIFGIGDTTLIENNIAATVTGDVAELRVSGSGATVTLTALVNGSVVATIGDTDAARITVAGATGPRVTNNGAGGTDICRAFWAGAIGGPAQGVTPSTANVNYGATQGFSATGGLPNETLNWSATSGSASPSSGTSTTYTAPGSGSSATVTWTSADLPTHTAAAAVTLLSGTASTFSLTGPSSGYNHNPSSNFTYAPNGNYTGTITPTMTGLAGTWAPTTLTWSGTATAQTATFTPSATGSGNANGTASPTLTQPANIAYASNPQTLNVAPGVLSASATATVTFTGAGTLWTTTAPTFTPAGVAGVSCGTVTVVSATSAHAPVTTGTATGTVTWTDSTTSATATQTVSTSAPVLSIVTGLASGLGTVGFAVINPDGTTYSAFTTAGVVEQPTGSGNYRATVLVPNGYSEIRWSNNNSAPFYPDVVNSPAATTGTGGGPTAAQIATAVWQDATAGDFTITGSIGKYIMTGVTINLAQSGFVPRNLGTVADAALTVGDALLAAICAAAGKETVVGTTYTIKSPSTGTTIRTFTLDSASSPSSRS